MRPGPKPTRATCHDAPNFAKGLCSRCYRREHARKNYRSKGWPAHLRRKYGLTVAELEQLIAQHEKRCAVCRREVSLHVDHDHTTGAIRGLLCGSCNRGIGLLGESPARMRLAAAYLETGRPVRKSKAA